MTTDATVTAELLGGLQFFGELSAEQLETLAGIAQLETVAKGDTVIWARKPADNVRVIVEGRLALALTVPGREDFVVTTVSSGVFGWSALTGQRVWMATTRALKDSTIVSFPGDALNDLCEADHDLGYFIMRRLFTTVAQRVQDAWLQLLDMYGNG